MTNWNHVGYQLKEPLTCNICGATEDVHIDYQGIPVCRNRTECWQRFDKANEITKGERNDQKETVNLS